MTPAISYLAACLGAVVALRSTRWALLSEGAARRNWLGFAAVSLGGGIWSMHFIAMLGFAVRGAEIRYDVPLTVLSLVVAITVVGIGLFTVGYSTRPTGALLVGGVFTGLGVAAMHYLGMAAMRLPGTISYDKVIVGISIGIAIFAATAALWAALNLKGIGVLLAAAPVMGVAVCAMHFTGMLAVSVHLSNDVEAGSGVTALKFIFPIAVGFGTYVFISSLAFAVAPSKEGGAQAVFLGSGPTAPAAGQDAPPVQQTTWSVQPGAAVVPAVATVSGASAFAPRAQAAGAAGAAGGAGTAEVPLVTTNFFDAPARR
ncbi:MHYT domain-containing protein [Kitasatospora misakiensis]|uniref:MHYT domain-containing protein n=1 Tax=Kitasatospora misakiensis TaxID=67330 RepID=A0ABW0X3V6_9ACTN